MEIKKGGLTIGVLCYVVWGILPAYWNLLGGVNSLLILCFRIVFSLVFTIAMLLISGRMRVFLQTIKDKTAMRYLIPASVLITFSWGLFIWAVNNEHILDTSLAYYINPLVSFLFGIIIFKEKSTKLQLAAVALAFTGMLISVIAYGSFPFISLSLALVFAAYGVMKKKAGADPLSGIAIESLIMIPFTLVFVLLFMADDISAASITELLLLIGGGALTAIPLAMYARAVNELPYLVIGFLQYICPSMSLVYGLMRGETLSGPRIVSFMFVGPALIVFSIALIISHKKSKTAVYAAPPEQRQ